MAVKNDRIRVYLERDTGTDGRVAQTYVLEPSSQSDAGYWAGFAFISGRSKATGAQDEHVVIYDVVTDDHVPIENTSNAIITRMPEETQRLKVQSVGYLRSTGEKTIRCLDVSDADYTLSD